MNFKFWLEENEENKKWSFFGHQKEFPFMRNPENPFIRRIPQEELKDFKDSEGEIGGYKPDALYHVTPYLNAIRSTGMLKSRAQLGIQGLGGGAKNESPHTVSMTYSFSRAKMIYEEFKYVIQICKGLIPASDIFYNALQQSENYDDQDLSNVEQVLLNYMPKKIVMAGDEEKIKLILNKKIINPKDKYKFFQELERALIDDNASGENTDYFSPLSTIGFTASFEIMVKMDVNQVAIIQCVIRKNAEIRHVPEELELRVSPQDVAIVRYLKP